MYKKIRNLNGEILETVIYRVSDNMWIPADPQNRDYREYQDWLNEGNSPLDPDKTQNDMAKVEITNHLESLDSYLPRSIEDYWVVTNFNTTTLPQPMQDRLALKISLRQQLSELG